MIYLGSTGQSGKSESIILNRGVAGNKKGTAFVVYDDILDAKSAVDHLSGFNVGGKYLIVLYYQPSKQHKKTDTNKEKQEIDYLKQKYHV